MDLARHTAALRAAYLFQPVLTLRFFPQVAIGGGAEGEFDTVSEVPS